MTVHARQASLVLTLIMLVLPLSLSAQPSRPGGRMLEVWGGSYAWSGEDVEGFDPGWQMGISLLPRTPGGVDFGVEGMAGRFDASSTESAWEFGVNVLLRWAMGPRDRTHPFLQGRLGWHRVSAEVVGVKLRQDGFSLGPEVGLVIPVFGRSGIVLAAGGSWQQYGNAALFASPDGNPTVGDIRGNAFRYGGRIGWVLGVGR